MKKILLLILAAVQMQCFANTSLWHKEITWDSLSLFANHQRVMPVMGEIHYSRVNRAAWAKELQKMKEGGITMIATYCFWNHIEEIEGQFDWSGQRSLRAFLEECRRAQMPVILRVGPFCHGEARNGGIPDWMFTKGCRMRSEDPTFMKYVRQLYEQIFTQVKGLQWKDGGPLIAIQFDNEYRGKGSYLMALKKIANEIGFSLPFYTRTGWPKLATPVPFGELLPLYGDYADGFWDRELTEGCGNYYQAFNFKPYRIPTATATEQLGKQKAEDNEQSYPFFTCEQGGGMMTSYHRRIWIAPMDVYSSALVKLGCGSNLLGYYMYHGGTNPDGKLTYLQENQRTQATNYNDMPVKTYDFQAPLGEFGQRNESYFTLRPLHLFMQDFGTLLAPMEAHYPQASQPQTKGIDTYLRWTYRSLNGAGFIFVNNYERFASLSSKKDINFNINGKNILPKSITVPAGASFILPVNIKIGDITIDYATAQLVANNNDKVYLMQIPGIKPIISINGKVIKTKSDSKRAICKIGNTEVYLVSKYDAEHLFLTDLPTTETISAAYKKVSEAGTLREITIGKQRVAEEPQDADFAQGAVYEIQLPQERNHCLLDIDYVGDVARLYEGDRLIDDNFYNGRHFQYDLSLTQLTTKNLKLVILPLQKDAPIYLPSHVKPQFGSAKSIEQVNAINLIYAKQPTDRKIDLSGIWQMKRDDCEQTETVTLPGSMLTNGVGNDITLKTPWTGSIYDSSFYFNPYMAEYRKAGNIKFPFFLTPNKHFIGNAEYVRQVFIPEAWRGERVTLFLERPHIETTLSVNGNKVGHQMSLSVPHEYDITQFIEFGKTNTLSLTIYNGIENVCVGQDSHSVTDQTQGNWNGVVGDISLRHSHKDFISHIVATPNLKQQSVNISLSARISKPQQISLKVELFNSAHKISPVTKRITISPNENGVYSTDIDLSGKCYAWDEFSPNLYRLTVYMGDSVSTVFGMRELTTNGRHLILNGKDLLLRGTVENCNFPLTGFPPTDTTSWLNLFRKCKEYGLNAMRFHSYCPPEAAFIAADITGFYLQPECPSWPNHGVKLGKGMYVDKYLMSEALSIDSAYGNHPSFCFLAAGNEPAGNWVSWCKDFVNFWKAKDNRHLYTSASVGGGWAWTPDDQFRVKGGARGLDWDRHAPQSQDNFTNDITHVARRILPKNSPDVTINEPFVSHETGQWCAFPDLTETSQYTGVYKAKNFEIFADLLKRNGMQSQARKFLMASGKLQTLCYKYDIERYMRTPEYAGFQLLGLNDYSGQGTALVGVLNTLWQEKGYCTSSDWTEFCAPVVMLAEMPKFTFSNSETLRAPIRIYNTLRTLSGAHVTYDITTSGGTIHSGNVYNGNIALAHCDSLGCVNFNLSAVSQPTKCTLSVAAICDGDTLAHNHWDFWVYPDINMPKTDGIYITNTLDSHARKVLKRGGKVLITAAGRITYGSDVKQHYLPVFWNTSWFKMRPPHTTGAYIDSKHPMFSQFPTDDWSNLNWWELLNKAQVINLSQFPTDYQSAVQPIDTWHISRKLGMIVEANVGNGKLLLTTIDIDSDLEHRLVARQLRASLISYMQSTDFAPKYNIAPETISALFTEHAPEVSTFTTQSPDELVPKVK